MLADVTSCPRGAGVPRNITGLVSFGLVLKLAIQGRIDGECKPSHSCEPQNGAQLVPSRYRCD